MERRGESHRAGEGNANRFASSVHQVFTREARVAELSSHALGSELGGDLGPQDLARAAETAERSRKDLPDDAPGSSR